MALLEIRKIVRCFFGSINGHKKVWPLVTYQFWSSEIILLLLSQYLLPESFTYLVSVLRISSIAAICSRVWVSSRISWKNNFNLSCIGSVACPLLGPGQWLPPTPTHAGSHISPCYISLIDHYSQPYNGPSLCKYNENESDKVLSHTPHLSPSLTLHHVERECSLLPAWEIYLIGTIK